MVTVVTLKSRMLIRRYERSCSVNRSCGCGLSPGSAAVSDKRPRRPSGPQTLHNDQQWRWRFLKGQDLFPLQQRLGITSFARFLRCPPSSRGSGLNDSPPFMCFSAPPPPSYPLQALSLICFQMRKCIAVISPFESSSLSAATLSRRSSGAEESLRPSCFSELAHLPYATPPSTPLSKHLLALFLRLQVMNMETRASATLEGRLVSLICGSR